ncbi:MAG: cytochrome c [Pseudomonadota bacterium]
MLRLILLAAVVLAVAGWFLSAPSKLSNDDLPAHQADPVAGERIFWAGGCGSCHATPIDGDRAQGEDRLALGGGEEFHTPYGVFRAPNISSDKTDGIGGWTALEFVNAMQRGVSPEGKHYYPVFPFASYARMEISDVLDLRAFLDTLPAVPGQAADHELKFPWSVRRGLGLWKLRYLSSEPVIAVAADDAAVQRGRELVEGAGHCGECHTPRDLLGGLQQEHWLAGAPDPEGKGRVPNITPASETLSDWSIDDLAYYFESGFTPDFDTAGGTMVAVQENLAQLEPADREAIAAYLKAIPARTAPDD